LFIGAKLKDGKVCGREADDMKRGLAAMTTASVKQAENNYKQINLLNDQNDD